MRFRIFFFILVSTLCFLVPHSAFAWAGGTHSLLAKESLRDVAQDWGLNQTIPITTLEHFLEKFSKEVPVVKTREDFARWLQINPNARFERPSKEEKKEGKTTPLEILIRYSQRADDGRDVRLSYDRFEQFWFGSGKRTASQAFRHMEKPAFDPLHPLNTFGFPLGRLGQASERAQIYFDLAVQAYRLGEPYWAWNFLGVGLHYIEDLSQPYHTAQLLPPLLLNGLSAYWQWGRKDNLNLIKVWTQVAANAHHYFEGYVDYFLTQDTFGSMWRQTLRGRETVPDGLTIRQLAKQVRDQANRFASDSISATYLLTDRSLLTPREYFIGDDENPSPESPLPFLNTDAKKRIKGAEAVSQIVLGVFKEEGKAIRTTVAHFLKAIKED